MQQNQNIKTAKSQSSIKVVRKWQEYCIKTAQTVHENDQKIGKEIKPLWHKNVTMMQHKNGSNVAHKYREYDKCKNTNGAERHSDGGQTARFTTAQAAIIKVINS